jgi:hypothetical protein
MGLSPKKFARRAWAHAQSSYYSGTSYRRRQGLPDCRRPRRFRSVWLNGLPVGLPLPQGESLAVQNVAPDPQGHPVRASHVESAGATAKVRTGCSSNGR